MPVETVLDVGVLHGTAELIQAYSDKHHVLFEPVAEFNEVISKNYASVSHTLECVALSDTDGEATLELRSIIAGINITHSTISTGGAKAEGKIYRQVPMTTLDAYLERGGLQGPYLLKIDVDGFELQILKGAVKTLRECSVVVVEAPKYQLVERVKFVQDAGFELYDLAEPCYYDDSFWQCDAMFVRRDLHREMFRSLSSGYSSNLYKAYRELP